MTLNELIDQLVALRDDAGVPGTATVLRFQAGDDDNYRDTEEEVWSVAVNHYTNHAPDVVIS